ncbi:hypothetical protein MKW92_017205 [Papaver armeniacum]|nr:hypothetical protein MKW92_017205 [Papaver armeniacum]
MVRSVAVGLGIQVPTPVEINGEIESLPKGFVPVVLAENEGRGKEKVGDIYRAQNILPYAVREHDADDEITGEREAYTASILGMYESFLGERIRHHLGYPTHVYVNYGALSNLQNFCINNCGNPFIEGIFGTHSRQFEVGVLDWFARLWEIAKDEYWGYITTGGTEGNFHGILVGRELFPDGILYTSDDSHYSVFRAAQIYRMNFVKVNSLISGEIDCADFKAKLLSNRNKPAIVNVNIGTTVKGGIDDLDRVIETLKTTGFSEDRFYIHCDGALFGLMMPFVKRAPKISFEKPIGSVCISGHKFLGCPMPCGVQITRLGHIRAISRNIDYIGHQDATLMGSRNGHAPIFLWYALNQKGYPGLQMEVQMCLKNAQYLKDCLRASGISAMLNEFSNIVVFEKPQNEEFVHYWQLAVQGDLAHIVVMPNITVAQLNDFLRDLAEKRAIWLREGKHQPLCFSANVGKENCACPRHK